MDDLILQNVIEVFADEADLEPEEITGESNIMNDLGLNSMEVMNSVARLEKKYSIRIPERDFRFFATVEDVAQYISD